MKKLSFILLLLICFVASSANAFNVKLTNNTDRAMVYTVVWLACDWEGFPPAQIMAAGEIKPGITNDLESNYTPGPYLIVWYARSNDLPDFNAKYLVKVNSRKGVLIATPSKQPEFTPGI